MTYNVAVELDSQAELEQVFAWLHNLGLKHIVDWRWFKHGGFVSSVPCTFQFEDAKYADWFALRWAE